MEPISTSVYAISFMIIFHFHFVCQYLKNRVLQVIDIYKTLHEKEWENMANELHEWMYIHIYIYMYKKKILHLKRRKI